MCGTLGSCLGQQPALPAQRNTACFKSYHMFLWQWFFNLPLDKWWICESWQLCPVVKSLFSCQSSTKVTFVDCTVDSFSHLSCWSLQLLCYLGYLGCSSDWWPSPWPVSLGGWACLQRSAILLPIWMMTLILLCEIFTVWGMFYDLTKL